jgi:segregation and condensation protein B
MSDAKDTEEQAKARPDEIGDDEIACVEALLFSSDSPLKPAKIVEAAGLEGKRVVTRAVEALNRRYDETHCAFRIESIADGYQMLTRPEYHDLVARLFRAKSESKLSPAALETLAIVAYRQPVLRADLEAIRGVASGEVLRGLMDKQLVKIVGRAEVIGRPMLYGTTRRFLEVFGLRNLADLPRAEELRRAAPEQATRAQASPTTEDSPEQDAETGTPAPEESPVQDTQADTPEANNTEPQPETPGPEAPQEQESGHAAS